MFSNLKDKNPRQSKYKNLPNADHFHSNPTSYTDATPTRAPIKGNEKDRLVRCKICGFPCDKERDVKSKDGTWAGLGISYSAQAMK